MRCLVAHITKPHRPVLVQLTGTQVHGLQHMGFWLILRDPEDERAEDIRSTYESDQRRWGPR